MMRRVIPFLVAGLVIGVMAFLFVLPARTWLGQTRATSAAQHRLTVLTQENAALQKRATQLQSSAYVEQLARQQYGLILPGEQGYAVLPATTVPVRP